MSRILRRKAVVKSAARKRELASTISPLQQSMGNSTDSISTDVRGVMNLVPVRWCCVVACLLMCPVIDTQDDSREAENQSSYTHASPAETGDEDEEEREIEHIFKEFLSKSGYGQQRRAASLSHAGEEISEVENELKFQV